MNDNNSRPDGRTCARRASDQRTVRFGAGVVGLLNISKPRGNILLDELDRLLTEKAPGVEVRHYTKPTFAKPCPDTLRHQIRDECDFLVEGLAD